MEQFEENLFNSLPTPALKKILGYLRYPELKALAEACPICEQLVGEEIRNIQKQFHKKKAWKWSRIAPGIADNMAERQKHCMVYYPANNSVYCFGGEVIGSTTTEEVSLQERFFQGNRPASFNDFWRFDMQTLKWERVIVPQQPYPSPKCGSSMVVWRDEIVLYGGHRPMAPGVQLEQYAYNQSEVHLYHPERNRWRTIPNMCNGPSLAGHSAVITNDMMLVYGGWTSDDQRARSRSIFILNLAEEKWYTVTLHPENSYRGPYELSLREMPPNDTFFPCMNPQKSQLVLLKEGLLLITGEMMTYDYGSSILVSFNPVDPQKTHWTWKRVETLGRWWSPRTILMEDGSRQAIATCALPNIKFDKVAVVREDSIVRLVSLGRLKGDNQMMKNELSEKYEANQRRSQQFVKFVRDQLEMEFERRKQLENDDELETSVEMENEGISCKILDCFVKKNVVEKWMQREGFKQTLEYSKVFVTSRPHQNWDGLSFDDIDLWELKTHLKVMINQLHAKFYPFKLEESICVHLPLRNRAVKRLAVYQVEIDVSQEDLYDNFEKIEWSPQPVQFHAAPETTDYVLIGAHHEIVMHGGCFEFNETMKRMGHTYILSLANEAPKAADLASPMPALTSATLMPRL